MDFGKLPDIYFEPEYGQLYEKMEQGKLEQFHFKNDVGSIYYQFIKRPIDISIDNNKYYDIVTPYGYGGPLIIDCNEKYKTKLINDFKVEFQKYCNEKSIISEFVRFHPVLDNARDFKSMYKIEGIRKTVGTNIYEFEDPIESEFSKSARKSIRRALNSQVSFKVTEKPTSLRNFIEIYYSTMDRNDASNYYYFDDEYFSSCLKIFKDQIILVEVIYDEKVIAAGFYFVYGKFVHAHLSGTLKEYLHLSPAYIIKYATAVWAIENNIQLIHYGGGTSNSEHDPLYQFKKKFGRNTEYEFCVGKKIWDEEAYEKLCKNTGTTSGITYFPAYRYNSSN
ncbi:hypothetical protein JOD29_003533 [Lysinibacillus composti]|uniref:GNAT family N-acetyltransferase n=1 Tax=Lysinibacillus composti TaxID=720633 RepID=UPI0013150C37|nr:GNAT family N-acetyltransferase [Lysinibacillus composti]MBM7610254.1 hypothetical protein [Lysinibacillus composti]